MQNQVFLLKSFSHFRRNQGMGLSFIPKRKYAIQVREAESVCHGLKNYFRYDLCRILAGHAEFELKTASTPPYDSLVTTVEGCKDGEGKLNYKVTISHKGEQCLSLSYTTTTHWNFLGLREKLNGHINSHLFTLEDKCWTDQPFRLTIQNNRLDFEDECGKGFTKLLSLRAIYHVREDRKEHLDTEIAQCFRKLQTDSPFKQSSFIADKILELLREHFIKLCALVNLEKSRVKDSQTLQLLPPDPNHFLECLKELEYIWQKLCPETLRKFWSGRVEFFQESQNIFAFFDTLSQDLQRGTDPTALMESYSKKLGVFKVSEDIIRFFRIILKDPQGRQLIEEDLPKNSADLIERAVAQEAAQKQSIDQWKSKGLFWRFNSDGLKMLFSLWSTVVKAVFPMHKSVRYQKRAVSVVHEKLVESYLHQNREVRVEKNKILWRDMIEGQDEQDKPFSDWSYGEFMPNDCHIRNGSAFILARKTEVSETELVKVSLERIHTGTAAMVVLLKCESSTSTEIDFQPSGKIFVISRKTRDERKKYLSLIDPDCPEGKFLKARCSVGKAMFGEKADLKHPRDRFPPVANFDDLYIYSTSFVVEQTKHKLLLSVISDEVVSEVDAGEQDEEGHAVRYPDRYVHIICTVDENLERTSFTYLTHKKSKLFLGEGLPHYSLITHRSVKYLLLASQTKHVVILYMGKNGMFRHVYSGLFRRFDTSAQPTAVEWYISQHKDIIVAYATPVKKELVVAVQVCLFRIAF